MGKRSFILRATPLFATLLVVFSCSVQLLAQGFTAAVSKNRVGINEPFQIEFTINESGGDFIPPSALKDFDVYSGPNHSQSVQYINGRMSQSISISYVIAAKHEGKITIGPATISVNGKQKQSNPITIEVLKGQGNAAANGGATGGNGGQGSNSGGGQGGGNNTAGKAQNGDENLFVRVSVNRSKVYQGEQILVTHKIYTRLNLRDIQNVKFPSYNGFWTQDVPQKGQIALTTENIDGIKYQVAEIKRSIIFPQRSGSIEIEPMEVSVVVQQRSSRQPMTIFDQVFGNGGYQDVLVKSKSKAVKVEVLPLPEQNKPASFAGAVGHFNLKVAANKTQAKTNEAIDLTVSISGSGNLKLIDPLKFNIPSDIEKYDPKTVDNTVTAAEGVSGTKAFDYLLIPRNAGNFKIDPVAFSYFDPEKKTYVTLQGPELSLSIEKGKDDNNATVSNTTSFSKEVVLLGNDIRFIKPKVNLVPKKEDGLFGSATFYTFCLLPFLGLVGAFGYKKKVESDSADGGIKLRIKSANRMANQRLAKANKHKKEQNNEQFYLEVLQATNGYLSDKLNIPVANLNKDNIYSYLETHGVSEESRKRLNDLLERCEFARYAPTAMAGNIDSTFNDAQQVISDLENQLKKTY